VTGTPTQERDLGSAAPADEPPRRLEARAGLFEHCPDVIFEMRVTSDGRFVQEAYNPAALRVIGRELDAIVGREPHEYMPEAAARTIVARYRECVAAGRTIEYDQELDFGAGARCYETRLVPVREAGGPVTRILGFARDITARRAAEQALRDSENLFSAAFRALPYSVAISDLETGRYLDVNAGFEKASGYTRDQVIGRTSVELNLWVDLEDRERFRKQMLELGKVRAFEIHFRSKSGQIVIALCNCDLIELGGRRCILNTFEDVTAHRQAEREYAELEDRLRQAQKLEALGTLAGGIAHDFNNLLAAATNYAELARLDAGDAELVRENLDEVAVAHRRARDLVSRILTFSRRQSQERTPTSLPSVVEEVMRFLRSSLSKSIRVELALESSTPPILANATQIHQVVMNLCTNAAHAMGSGGGTLGVRVEPVHDEEGSGVRRARLVVEDTGAGMSEETLSRLYEPFFTTKQPGEGTGLGLSVVHGIVRDHGATISVHSELGRGTRFVIEFPALVGAAARAPSSIPPLPRGSGEHILVVDDEGSIARSSKIGLERLGFRVTSVSTSAEALELVTTSPRDFDAVLTDLSMPAMNGLELSQALLLRNPSLPIVLVSGHVAGNTRESARALGIREVLQKPASLVGLATTLVRILRQPSER
jgi:two-component system cell cycle sensor histidine kinase/response regulator CckA